MRKDFGIDIILGATDEDLKLYQKPVFQTGWSKFSMLYQGPQKSFASFDLGGMKTLVEETGKSSALKKEAGATDSQLRG